MKTLLLMFGLIMSFNLLSQNVGINTTGAAPNSSAMLDIAASNKGLLIPRIAFASRIDVATIPSAATSLLIYNTFTSAVATASNNVSPGYYYWDGTKWMAFSGNGSKNWNLLGNQGTVDGTDFIGTTDNIPFNIKVNNQKAGRIDVSGNSNYGYQAGNGNTTGTQNTSLGYQALLSITTASNNTAVGSGALSATTAGSNTALGYNTGTTNTSGTNNTFIGHNTNAGAANLTNASAIGANSTVSASNAIVLGNNANVGIGTSNPVYAKLQVVGFTLFSATNIAMSATTRSAYIRGNDAYSTATTPNYTWWNSDQTGIFHPAAAVIGFCTNGFGEVMRITNNRLGIGTTTPNGLLELGLDQARKPGTATWTIVSDERLKNITGNYTKGLAEILKLKTITYQYKNAGEQKFRDEVLSKTQVGFSAQEIQKIFPEAVDIDSDGYLNFNMHAILVAYTNAIKELDAKNKEQEIINIDLKKRIETLEALIIKNK